MKFISDRQRKAVMANMFSRENKFHATPMRPIFDQMGVRSNSVAGSATSEEARAEGYTGAEIYADKFGKDEPIVITQYGGIEKPKGETIILAGEGYGMEGKHPKVIDDLVTDIMVHTGATEEQAKDQVSTEMAKMAAEMNRHRLGYPVYSVSAQKEYISGGYADGCADDEYDPEQIQKGIEVEKEHVIKFTDKGNVRKFKDIDLAKAKEIAKDHLAEIPDYYDRLEAMEEGAKEEGVYIDVVEQKKLEAGKNPILQSIPY